MKKALWRKARARAKLEARGAAQAYRRDQETPSVLHRVVLAKPHAGIHWTAAAVAAHAEHMALVAFNRTQTESAAVAVVGKVLRRAYAVPIRIETHPSYGPARHHMLDGILARAHGTPLRTMIGGIVPLGPRVRKQRTKRGKGKAKPQATDAPPVYSNIGLESASREHERAQARHVLQEREGW